MKCKCCEKEINEKNSIQEVCLECNNEIIKKIKINKMKEQYNTSPPKTDFFIIKLLILIILFSIIHEIFIKNIIL